MTQMLCLTVANRDVLKDSLAIEKSLKDTPLLRTNTWSCTAECLVDLIFLPKCVETPICSETQTLK